MGGRKPVSAYSINPRNILSNIAKLASEIFTSCGLLMLTVRRSKRGFLNFAALLEMTNAAPHLQHCAVLPSIKLALTECPQPGAWQLKTAESLWVSYLCKWAYRQAHKGNRATLSHH